MREIRSRLVARSEISDGEGAPMNAVLMPLGSHGDVLPLVGLASELQHQGLGCTVVANPAFESAIAAAKIPFVALGTVEDYQKNINDPDLYHPTKGLRMIGRMIDEYSQESASVVRQLCGDRTILIGTTLSFPLRCLSELLGLPSVTVHLQPSVVRSFVDPPLLAPKLNFLNRLPLAMRKAIMWAADRFLVDPILARPVNRLRFQMGLPPIRRILGEWSHQCDLSLLLCPDWFTGRPSDWPLELLSVGFPLYDQESSAQELDPALQAHLEEIRGRGRPIVVGTGGTGFANLRQFYERFAQACQQVSAQGLIITRHPANIPNSLPGNVRAFAYAPFSQLLPLCDMIVHHGGIGTTSQALRAGIPQVIAPLAHDQFDNANRIERLGLGRWCRRHKVEPLSQCMQAILEDRRYQERCAKLPSKVESGLPQAARAIISRFS